MCHKFVEQAENYVPFGLTKQANADKLLMFITAETGEK